MVSSSALRVLLAAFLLGFTTLEVDARPPRHWHPHHHRHHHKSHKHHRHHVRSLPPIVVAHVYVGSQQLEVDVNGQHVAEWAVSTARAGYHTPHGMFHVSRMARIYYSKKYDNSPMPNSVFFLGGNAIHGTNHVNALGRPASHGCVRLLPAHAAQLFSLIQYYGMNRTRIIVSE